MLKSTYHGAAHIRVSKTALDPVEFYGVFWHGTLQPSVFASWRDAHVHFKSLEGDR